MAADLELIEQLEKEIGINLKEIDFDKIEFGAIRGFAIDEKGEVIGLNLNGIELEPLPISLSKFNNCRKLSLDRTKIKDIYFLKNFNHLSTLYLRSNQITDISLLKDLSNLIDLDLRNNQITDICFLKDLNHLKTLGLRNNNIKDISFIQCFKNLASFDLCNNKIKELPESIVEMAIKVDSEWTGRGEICLYGNPIEKPPLEIVKKGRKATKAYFKSLRTGENIPLNEVKVLLVGDGGVGKTSLMKRLLGQAFDGNEFQTHGININPWEVKHEDDKIKVNLWDFGGQEIMHATHQFFLSRRSLYLLLLDGRKDGKPEYWLKHIESFGGNSPVMVVVNKIDENPGFEVNRKFLQEKYKSIKGFYRISCKTKEGIGPFVMALKKALSQVEILKTTWPNSWFNVKNRLENMPEPFISYKEYQEICSKAKIAEESCKDTLVDYLNDLGVILHFKDFELEDTQVLEPRWVTEAVYKIINSRILAENKGVLELKSLDKILEKREGEKYYYSKNKHRYIVNLMQKFELCFRIDDETILIPNLLEVNEPNFDFDYVAALKFIIQYDFLPRGIMPRFIVNMHKNIKDEISWRTGVVLEDKDFESTAVIKADHEAKRIYIYVAGGQKRDYFAALLATLRHINKSFEKLKTTELIPMPGEPEITADYKQLIRFEKEGIEYYLPGETDKKYKVKDLLGTVDVEIDQDETLQMLKIIRNAQMQKGPAKKST